MGQKHREIRKALKAETRAMEASGWYQNEFGELRKRTTKAEARRWLLRSRKALDAITRDSLEAGRKLLEKMRPQMEEDILMRMSNVVQSDMDREVLGL